MCCRASLRTAAKIVFTSVVSAASCAGNTQPTTSILTMSSTDGSGRTTLVDGATGGVCFNMEPRYAPGGEKIAYMCGPEDGSVQICSMNPDGSGTTLLTRTPDAVAADAHWSWDGQRLAISRRDTSGNVNVWTMLADGSDLTQITTFTEPVEGGDVGWSLDDSQLVFE